MKSIAVKKINLITKWSINKLLQKYIEALAIYWEICYNYYVRQDSA